MKNRKKAFSLTELLVVVVVIGVLAAVGLPQFNRAMESRRTSEAEGILFSIRTEQEKRCSLDKKYAANFKQLGPVVPTDSKNETMSTGDFEYLLNADGATARRADLAKGYLLSMPSYLDGRLCCDGDYCSKLNKNYPSCTGFSVARSADCASPIFAGSACEVDSSSCECNPNQCKCPAYAAANCTCTGTCAPPPECVDGETKSNSCNGCGTQLSTCSGGKWALGACDKTVAQCATPPPDPCAGKTCTGSAQESQVCNTCGTQTRNRTCECGAWKAWSAWGTCSKTVAQCSCAGDATETQACNTCGTQTRTRTCSNGEWKAWSAWGTCSKTVAQCPEESKCLYQTRSWADNSITAQTSGECGNCNTNNTNVFVDGDICVTCAGQVPLGEISLIQGGKCTTMREQPGPENPGCIGPDCFEDRDQDEGPDVPY